VSEKTRKIPTCSPVFNTKTIAKSQNIGVNAISKELGIPSVTLRDWIQKSGTTGPSSGAKPSYEELEREVQKLRREVAVLLSGLAMLASKDEFENVIQLSVLWCALNQFIEA